MAASLLTRLRSRAIRASTPARRAFWTRAYLRHKARRGNWDRRFLGGHPNNISWPVRRYIMRGVAAGLQCTSTTDGGHASGSYHYPRNCPPRYVNGAAADMAGSRRRMVAFQRAEAKHPDRYRELFGPDNAACVDNGKRMTLAEHSALEDQHDNHVH